MLATGPPLPVPRNGCIDLWQASIAPQTIAALESRLLPILSDGEQVRLRRIQAETVRHEALLVLASLRILLGRYLACDGATLNFQRGPYGKPALSPEFPTLYFNATYTTGLLAIAVAADREVGVDVESLRRPISPVLLRKALAPEEQVVCGDDPHRFLAFWTLKEAYLKCLGIGLRVRPSKIAFSLDGPALLRPAPGFEAQPVDCWQGEHSSFCLAVVAAARESADTTVYPQDLRQILGVQGCTKLATDG